MENTKTINTQFGAFLEGNASSLTQGNNWGKYPEGSNGTWYA